MSESICEELRDLIAWYPGGSLSLGERNRVDEHLDRCEECADLLRFAEALGKRMKESEAQHPEADALVAFVENPATQSIETRDDLKRHLERCPGCSDITEILGNIDRDLEKQAASKRTTAASARSVDDRPSRRRSYGSMLLHPASAAVYLAIAILAIALHLIPGESIQSPFRQDPLSSGTEAVHGVIVVPNEMDRQRAASEQERVNIHIKTERTNVLLLEFTTLESAPNPEQEYIVEIIRGGDETPVLRELIFGRAFLDNYTLSLTLDVGTCVPGEYRLLVSPRGDKPFYRSTLIVD